MTSPVDPLVRAALPVLLHGLANTTQLLTGLRSALAFEGGEALFASRAGDLAGASGRIGDLGYALAVLGSASGADLLLARREPRGLAILVGIADEVVRRDGRVLAGPEELPLLAPQAQDGWQLPWAVASLLLASANDHAEGALVPWGLAAGPRGWELALPAGTQVETGLERVLPRLRGAEAEREGERWRLALPAPWLVTG
jgi:hypothetical protein